MPNGWGNTPKFCIGCKKEYPMKDSVVVATNNYDGTGVYMCNKCYGRGKRSLGGWQGIVEGDTVVMSEARKQMWDELEWGDEYDHDHDDEWEEYDEYSEWDNPYGMDDDLLESNLGWEPEVRVSYKGGGG